MLKVVITNVVMLDHLKSNQYVSKKYANEPINSGLNRKKKNHCDGDIIEHIFRLQRFFLVIWNPGIGADNFG